jgi:hypothetical protein
LERARPDGDVVINRLPFARQLALNGLKVLGLTSESTKGVTRCATATESSGPRLAKLWWLRRRMARSGWRSEVYGLNLLAVAENKIYLWTATYLHTLGE